ncbi:YbhB/YbcL family Raf kinase inhibitor-like protein [Caballeronia sp. BR00000012568055]|uniref:YbhB/YbcL family Raf kinase inhibitor-like protein n=1 Tax=Caballeronia sp. BR00000012568055 TaxID=2918761 RepID=UPI0023F92FF4|nr:YbhB/YbcL family Raf kinase inhibitor-like protein [Caballeronia sp. BR00000012568055]
MRLACRIVGSVYRLVFVFVSIGALTLLIVSHDATADPAFTLSSPDLVPGKPVSRDLLFDDSECKGGNHSPQLSWRGAPAETKSYGVTIVDPDAPGRGWYHWAIAGIPAGVTHLPANASASGALGKLGAVQARNDWGTDGYGGPCPPPGKPHRYVITVYALGSDDLRLRQGTPALMFDHEIRTMALATAQLTFEYGR